MKKFKKISTILFLSTYLLIGFSIAGPTLAVNDVFFVPQIGVPGSEFQQGVSTTIGHVVGATTTSDLLARYVKAFYNWGLSIVGVLAVLMLMAGGLTWLTSAGDSGKIENAKKMISGSLFGTLLLLGAYFFLNTINPDLAKLPVIEMAVIEKINMPTYLNCCDPIKGETKIPTQVINGKNIATEGSLIGKEIKCTSQYVQCSANQICTKDTADSKNSGHYICADNNFCCSCEKAASITEVGLQYLCKNHTTLDDCNSWCFSLTGAFGTKGIPTLSNGNSQCGSDNKCYSQVNGGCGTTPGSKCHPIRKDGLLDACPIGYSKAGANTPCSDGNICCYAPKKLNESCRTDHESTCLAAVNNDCPDGSIYAPGGYDCTGDLKCCKKNGKQKNEACGTISGASCQNGCAGGFSKTSPNPCGGNLLCCSPNGEKKEGDSCGTKPGAVCTKAYNSCPGTLHWDITGSSCPGGSLWCCYE